MLEKRICKGKERICKGEKRIGKGQSESEGRECG